MAGHLTASQVAEQARTKKEATKQLQREVQELQRDIVKLEEERVFSTKLPRLKMRNRVFRMRSPGCWSKRKQVSG